MGCPRGRHIESGHVGGGGLIERVDVPPGDERRVGVTVPLGDAVTLWPASTLLEQLKCLRS